LDEVLPEVDAIMMLRVQLERMSDSFFPSAREYSRYFGLNQERLAILKSNAIVMHPGPMNRGLEITAESADSARSVIVEQVSNGINVRMAILYLLLAGEM
jgi:aspartate carbamoyltransferase catalytic subunit